MHYYVITLICDIFDLQIDFRCEVFYSVINTSDHNSLQVICFLPGEGIDCQAGSSRSDSLIEISLLH